MSLSRLALRLAACEALCPALTLAQGPWPTIAGQNVYDTRLDPIQASDNRDDWNAFVASIDGKPLVMVYAEEHEVEPYSGDYPAERNVCELVVELMIAARGQVSVETAAGAPEYIGSVDVPVTDRQHEALLDLLEGQVGYLLDPANMAPSAGLYRKLAQELHHVHSVPMRDAAKTARLAARTIKFKLRIPATRWPPFAAVPPRSGLDLLPEPLKTVAQALPPASSGGQLCAALAPLIAQPGSPIPLEDMRLLVNFGRGAKVPTKPDGSDADIVADAVPPSFASDFTQDFG